MNVPTIGANFDITGYTTVKCTGDPQKDAKNFANANNISVEEAKKILSGQFGAPKKQSTDAVKTATNTVDDDAELDEDADLDLEEVDAEKDIDDVDDTDDVENEEDNDEIDDTVIDELDSYVSDINDQIQETKNAYNIWQKWGGGWQNNGTPLWKFHGAAKELQTSIESFLDYVDTIDMSSLDYDTRKAIDDAKDDARKWSDKFAKATKTEWYSNATLWQMAGSARKKAVNFTETLVAQLQSAGLTTTEVNKNPGKPADDDD